MFLGYVLTESGNKNCAKRDGSKVSIVKCDKGYSGFNLQCNDFAIYDLLSN